MTPGAIAQFVVSSYLLQGGHDDAVVCWVWPARFGSGEGFGFEYGYTTSFSIDVHALGARPVKDGKLYLIDLEGPAIVCSTSSARSRQAILSQPGTTP